MALHRFFKLAAQILVSVTASLHKAPDHRGVDFMPSDGRLTRTSTRQPDGLDARHGWRFLQGSLLACGLLMPSMASAEPNVLLIIADDMGLDASHCYEVGEQQAPMPHLEQLCQEGLVFDKAYAAPVCSPTRATIMTGRYGFRTGVGTAIPRDRDGAGLSADEVSLFDILAGTEYSSAVIGKWHLAGGGDDLNHPAELGVEEYFGLFSGGLRDYSKWNGVHNGSTLDITGYATSVLTDRAIDWIGAQQTPWFLWLAYNAPHTPFHLPPAELHNFDDLPGDEASIEADALPYFNASLAALDTEMGRLLDSLPPATRDNTVVIFIGDNGTTGRIARPLYGGRRAKGSIYEGGTHVPMVVQGPGVEQGRTDALINTTDLHATIAALAGAKTAAPDAIDFTPVLSGGAGERRHVYVEHFSEQEGRRASVFGWAIRDDRFKLVSADGQTPELFDLEADPFERENLLAGSPSGDAEAKAAELRGAYEEIRQGP